MYMYMYIYVCMIRMSYVYIHIYTCVYIYRKFEIWQKLREPRHNIAWQGRARQNIICYYKCATRQNIHATICCYMC